MSSFVVVVDVVDVVDIVSVEFREVALCVLLFVKKRFGLAKVWDPKQEQTRNGKAGSGGSQCRWQKLRQSRESKGDVRSYYVAAARR